MYTLCKTPLTAFTFTSVIGILFTQAPVPRLLGKFVKRTRGLKPGVPRVGFKKVGYSECGNVSEIF